MKRTEIFGIVGILSYAWFVAAMFFIFGNSSPTQTMPPRYWKDPLMYPLIAKVFLVCPDSWPFYFALGVTMLVTATIVIEPIRLKMWDSGRIPDKKTENKRRLGTKENERTGD